jgi:hypothetical protein
MQVVVHWWSCTAVSVVAAAVVVEVSVGFVGVILPRFMV